MAFSTEGIPTITFDIETEALVEGDGHGVLDTEPMQLVWATEADIGRKAPLVLSGRRDFPRELGHVVAALGEMGLCLARTGLQPIYDRWGIEGVLTRLRSWLRDAKTGCLMRDGWEPVPFPSDSLPMGAFFDARKFQELATARRGDGVGAATGVARIAGSKEKPYLVLNDATPYASDDKDQFSSLHKAIEAANHQAATREFVPWVFIWSDSSAPIEKPIFGDWRTEAQVQQGLLAARLAERFDAAIGKLVATSGCKFGNFTGERVIILIVGIWRPKPILPAIFGLSEDHETARRLELKAYWLQSPYAKSEFLGAHCTVLPVVADPVPTSELLRFTSGTKEVKPVALIGAGALGSVICEHLVRMGVEQIRVVDKDRLRPHNVARHVGRIEDVYKDKVDVLEDLCRSVALNTNVVPLNADAASLTDEQMKAHFGDARLILDASADERVRGRLAEFVPDEGQQIVRTEIYNRGRLGVQFVTGPSNAPDLLDLYYLLCREALERDDLADWLRALHFGGADAEELLFGFGCASMSTRLPGWVVGQHAAAFMPTISAAMSGDLPSGIGLNTLDDEFRPLGWRWIEAPPMEVFTSKNAPGWTVSVAPQVLDFIRTERTAAQPNETGGYLYGGWDAALKRIVVVEATDLPPGSQATPVSLKLGPAGFTAKEKRIAHRTVGRISLCGTWHSHPNGSAAMSRHDRATIANCREADELRGIPTLLLVAADGEEQVHLQA